MQGLIDGTVEPSELEAAREWSQQHGEDPDGIHARLFALQDALGGTETGYLFEDKEPAPTARIPHYVDDHSLTVLFNDRKGHLQITSVAEFVSSNDIHDYVIEALSPEQLRTQIRSRVHRYLGKTVPTDEEPALYKGQRVSITIERSADAAGQLREPVLSDAIVSELNAHGFDVTCEEVTLDSPLEELGLFRVPVQLDPETLVKVAVWVVPSVESDTK